MRRARLEQKKGSSWVGRRRISKAGPIRPHSQDSTAHPTPGGWPVRCCKEVRGFTLPPRVSQEAQRVSKGRSIRRVSCLGVFPLPAPGEKSGQGYSPYVRVSGLVSCLNGPALEAGFISRRFWLDAAWTRGVAAAFQLRSRQAKNIAFSKTSTRQRPETSSDPLVVHSEKSSRRLPSVNFKKTEKLLVVYFFYFVQTASTYTQHGCDHNHCREPSRAAAVPYTNKRAPWASLLSTYRSL